MTFARVILPICQWLGRRGTHGARDVANQSSRAKLPLVGILALGLGVVAQDLQAQGGVWLLPGTTSVTSATVPGTPGWLDEAVTAPLRPTAELFRGETVVTSGFSGSRQRLPIVAPDAARPDPEAPEYRFIDLEGASAALTGIPYPGFGPNAQELDARPYDRIFARDVGQIFGLAIDDIDPAPTLYLAATSVYGLPIVTADANGDRLPDRHRRGLPGADWMAGLFGPEAGPGTIWRVDGQTGQITQFADVRLDGVENAGPGLGNIARDRGFGVLHVSDRETGMIFRLSPTGAVLEHFDHGVDGRMAQGLSAAPFDPAGRMDRTRPDFDADDPLTWGFAKPERRVWGLAVHDGRLFYAVARGRSERPEVWSVGLEPVTGAYLRDARWEITLPDDAAPHEISDIAFTHGGLMLLAQRAAQRGAFDFVDLSDPQQAGVFGYALRPLAERTPDDRWQAVPVRYDVGFAGHGDNANGGLALGPGVDVTGQPIVGSCHGGLWTTGENLRQSTVPATALALAAGGASLIDGLQVQPLAFDRRLNSPPWVSNFLDYDAVYPMQAEAGHLGDIEVLGCRGEPTGGDDTWYPEDPGDEPLCERDPRYCPPPIHACASVRTQMACDVSTGQMGLLVDYGQSLPTGFDRVIVSDPSGTLGGLPQQGPALPPFAVTLGVLVPGQTGNLLLCAFDSAQAASGEPYDCCHVTVPWQAPAAQCAQESN